MKITQRVLWFLIAMLVASNLVTAMGLFWLLGRMDRAYSEIVDPAFASLKDLRELKSQSMNMQRAILNLLLATDATEQEVMRQRFAKAVQVNRWLLDRFHQTNLDGIDDEVELTLGRTGASYLQCASTVCGLVDAGRGADAQLLRTTELRKTFEAYQAAQAVIATSVSDHAMVTSSNLATFATGLRRLLVAAAGLPLLLLSALVLSFAVFIVLLYRIIRRLQFDR